MPERDRVYRSPYYARFKGRGCCVLARFPTPRPSALNYSHFVKYSKNFGLQWCRTDAELMTEISPKFSQTGAPVLNVDDAGGKGLPVIFQHGLRGDARQTIEAFPRDPRFRRITIESRSHGGSEAGDPRLFSVRTFASDVAASSMRIIATRKRRFLGGRSYSCYRRCKFCF